MSFEIITGIHSIAHALANPQRKNVKLYMTNSAQSDLDKQKNKLNFDYRSVETEKVKDADLQTLAQREFKNYDFNYQRVPNNIFLISEELDVKHPIDLYQGIEKGDYKKILCLDQVTDVHNMAAIFRTASFYNVDAIIFSRKGDLKLSPTFYRISSGGREYIDLVKVTNLSKVVTKMNELDVTCLGFSEHETSSLIEVKDPLCLILGSEDLGISHAVLRNIKHFVKLENKGQIQTLNVSVASAVAMEKFF